MIKFYDTESKLNILQIEEIEKYVGLNFPIENKNHLLNYNGGRCIPDIFEFKENGNLSESCIDWFLAIYDGKYDNLKRYIDIYKLDYKRLPSHILPIAHDPGGNLICISCNENENGYIYFWDHENEVDYITSHDKNFSNMHLIAKSFNEFIHQLKEDN